MNEPTGSSLDEQLARLKREVPPRVDLWPSIEQRIRRRAPVAPPLALAAGLVALIGTAVIVALLHARAPSLPAAHPQTASVAALFDEPHDPRYLAARAALEKTFEERVALLDPVSRASIERSLEQIRSSRAELRRALAANPDNPLLEQLLESTWHEEFDLYDDVVQDTQPTLARN